MRLREISLQEPVDLHTEQAPPSAFERLRYLCPSRYFRSYMLYERMSHSTCWLPEGYDS